MQRLQPSRSSQSAQSAPARQSRSSRRPLVVRADAPKLLPLLATAAAVGATAITVRHVMQRQRQGAPAQQQQRQRERPSGGGSGGGSSSSAAGWAAALASRQVQGLTFGWPLQSKEQKKERQLLATLQDIEHRQYSEEQAALRHFDARLGLRAKTLAELRAMAQQHNIVGRSKMRKRELVAALEAAMGFDSQPPHQQHRPLL